MMNKKLISIYTTTILFVVIIVGAFFVKNGVFGITKELLKSPLVIEGNKNIIKQEVSLEPGILSNKKSIVLSYNLKGVCLLGGPASAFTLKAEDKKTYSVSLSDYGQNCAFGEQTINIPIKDFLIDQPLKNIQLLATQFWYPTSYKIEINKITAYKQVANILYNTTKNIYAVIGLSSKRYSFEISRNSLEPTYLTLQSAPPPYFVVSTTTTTGYRAEYWNTSGLPYNPKIPTSTPNLTRNDATLNFSWGFGSPSQVINIDHFVARWQKNIVFEAGTYRFVVTVDDGVRIYIDGILILNKWKDQPATTYKLNRVMTSGEHIVKVEYFEDGGESTMKFDSQKIGPITTSTPIPTASITPKPSPSPTVVPTIAPILTPTPTLSPTLIPSITPTPPATPLSITGTSTSGGQTVIQPADSFLGEYWNTPNESYNPKMPTLTPNLVRNDSAINFIWNFGSPNPIINIDHFVARWQKNIVFEAGTYRFTTVSDDGVRVYIDNNIIINEWRDQGDFKYLVDKIITAGTHAVKVEYFEDGGGATMKFDFQKIVTSTTSTPVPTVIITSTPTPTPTPIPTVIPSPTATPTSTIIPSPIVSSSPSALPTPTPTSIIIPLPTLTPSPVPTILPSVSPIWSIRSVSSMKETKDKICGQDSSSFINSWINKAVELGANYIAVETPYDNPACGSSVAYTKAWVDAVHARGLNVWHRHMPLAFEGIYNVPKNSSISYLSLITDYIKANPTFFTAGDIFSPIPEPQNGGISGITYCPQNICIFGSPAIFNKWLRDAMTNSELAFGSIGLGGKIKIGYFGFDGFVAWGDNNPDWHGILEDATVQQMGNITIDHYPEIVGDTMENDLNELQAKYPTIQIVIGEWGTITGGDIAAQVTKSMQAAIRPNVIGFNYWHMGMGGNEALINSDFTNRANFDGVKSFFLR